MSHGWPVGVAHKTKRQKNKKRDKEGSQLYKTIWAYPSYCGESTIIKGAATKRERHAPSARPVKRIIDKSLYCRVIYCYYMLK